MANTFKILYIDDDPKYRRRVREAFLKSSCQVAVCRLGKEGVRKCETFAPDIVVVDCFLSDFSAEEMLVKCSSVMRGRHIPFIALTFNGKVDKLKLYSLGYSTCLGKPFKACDLQETIEDVMVSHQFKMQEMLIWDKIMESRNFLEKVVESAVEAIITLDRNGIITFCNKAYEELTGHSFEELIGRRISVYMKEGSTELLKIASLLKRKKTIPNYKTHLVGKNKEIIPVITSITIMRDPSGKQTGALCMGKRYDVRHKDEYIACQSSKLAPILETAVAVNHAINNPLVPILGNVQYLLQCTTIEPVELRERLSIIQNNAMRIRNFTHKLARISNPVTVEYMKGTRMIDIDAST